MVRGYDSGVVLREDIIERVRQYYAEIEQLQKEMDEIKKRLGIEDGDSVTNSCSLWGIPQISITAA